VLSEIRQAIIEQWGVFGSDDMIPLPCNPDAISIGYGLRLGGEVRPVTHLFPQEVLVQEAPNSVTFESQPEMRRLLVELLSLYCAGQQSADVLHEVLCCLPLVELPEPIGYDRVFRVTVVSFLDRFNFCLAGVKRSCIHFVTDDGPHHSVRHLQSVSPPRPARARRKDRHDRRPDRGADLRAAAAVAGRLFRVPGFAMMSESTSFGGQMLAIGIVILAVMGLLFWLAIRRRPPPPGSGTTAA